MSAETSAPRTATDRQTAADSRWLGKGLAALRIFFGLIFFANGLAKLFGFRTVEIGPYRSFLVNREETRSILQGEAARNDLPGIPALVNDVLLPNFGWLQWVITFVELGVGAARSSSASPRAARPSSASVSSSSSRSCTSRADAGCSSSRTSTSPSSSCCSFPPGASGDSTGGSSTAASDGSEAFRSEALTRERAWGPTAPRRLAAGGPGRGAGHAVP
jgi:uncharacterized membrane protein YphA (DoxX/SURF4 family)